jgi:hypothetical protein
MVADVERELRSINPRPRRHMTHPIKADEEGVEFGFHDVDKVKRAYATINRAYQVYVRRRTKSASPS